MTTPEKIKLTHSGIRPSQSQVHQFFHDVGSRDDGQGGVGGGGGGAVGAGGGLNQNKGLEIKAICQ